MAFLAEMREVAKDSLIYGLSSSLSRMVSLLTAPIVTRILIPADYGVVALVQLAMGFFVMIAGMNIGSGVSYYYFREKSKGEGQEDVVLTSGLFVTVVFAVLVAGSVGYFAEPIAAFLEMRSDGSVSGYDMVTFIRLAAVGLFFSLIITAIQTILRLWREPITFLKLEVVSVFLGVVLVLWFIVWLRTGVIGIFWVGIIAPAIVMSLGLYTVRRILQPKVSLAILGLVFAYCLPQMPGVFVNWAQTQLGRWFVNYFASLTELGLYSIAFSVSSVFVIAISAFRMAYGPYSLSIMERPDAKKVYSRVYTLFSAIYAVLAGGIGAFSRPILLILTPESYHAAYVLIPYLVMASFYMGANNILGTGIWISRKTSYSSYAQIVAFITLILASITLVPSYHALGAAIAYLLATIAQSFSYYIFAQRLWPIPYDYWRTHGVIAVVLAINIIHNRLISDLSLLGSLVSAFFVSLLIVVLVWLLGISKTNKRLIISRLSTWIKDKGYEQWVI